jgi:hypothetical protein
MIAFAMYFLLSILTLICYFLQIHILDLKSHTEIYIYILPLGFIYIIYIW